LKTFAIARIFDPEYPAKSCAQNVNTSLATGLSAVNFSRGDCQSRAL
jgi:hypothetical protein